MNPLAFLQRAAIAGDAESVASLVHASFRALAAVDWSAPAARTFLDESTAEAMRVKIPSAAYAAIAQADAQAVGFILLPEPNFLGMLFVHPEWVRRGVGRSLWEGARAFLETAHAEVETVELFATPFALPFYRAIGFVPISAEFSRDGARATRMACWLPARRFYESPGYRSAGEAATRHGVLHCHPYRKPLLQLYMVIERFRNGDPEPVYRRFRERGRMAPEGLTYLASWVADDMTTCYQVMETAERALLEQWMSNWCDLVEFEVHRVMTSADAADRISPHAGG